MRRLFVSLIIAGAFASATQALGSTVASPCHAEEGVCAGSSNIITVGQCPTGEQLVEFAPEVKFRDEWTLQQR